ncbi:MAG: NUDIX domain-containing protein [Gemmatimonadales bacterium]
MTKRAHESAGLLLFRRTASHLEVFLAHPGGPFWRSRDTGAWTIPKGMIEPGEAPLDAARREFSEETGITPVGPYRPLGSIRQKSGKTVSAWAWEGNAAPADVVSNTAQVEVPRKSGRWISFPEVDRCAWFGMEEARGRINPAQAELLDRLAASLATE